MTDRQTRRAYEFAKRASDELESRLRDMGIHEGNLCDHEVRRELLDDGRWRFTLDGATVLVVDPVRKVLLDG